MIYTHSQALGQTLHGATANNAAQVYESSGYEFHTRIDVVVGRGYMGLPLRIMGKGCVLNESLSILMILCY